MTERKQHSHIGASICERYWNCPGSITLYGHLKSPSSFYAAQGTAAHTIGETYLRKRIPVDIGLLGVNIKVEEEDQTFLIPVDMDMIDAVGEYVDFVYNEMAKYNSPWHRLHVEVGFSLSHIDPEAYGTCDAMLYVPFNRIIVIDYKHGAGVSVEIEDNKQTKYYGLGAYYSLPEDERCDIEYIETVIVQPRCAHQDGTIRRMVYTVQELLEWERGLSRAIQRVRGGDETLQAGKHCKFCPGKPHCPEAKNEVARLAAVDFADIDVGPPDVRTLTPEQVAHLLQFVPFIKDWCDDLLEHARTMAENNIDIPGYKLVDKRSNRKWIDEDAVIDEYELHFGEKLYTKKLLSPAQLEKMLPKDKRAELERLWEKPPAGKTLVRVEDDREARLPSAVSDFIDLDI
jgi:hypothetical protein